MKKLLFLFALIFFGQIIFSQEFKKPSEGKSMVYFVRYSPVGALINFKYFDGDKYLGKANNANYFTYECEPGNHLFWVTSENRKFIKGELLPNKTYVIEVRPVTGVLYAAVKLFQVNPNDERIVKRIKKFIQRRGEVKPWGLEEDYSEFIQNGLEKYENIKENVTQINSQYFFN